MIRIARRVEHLQKKKGLLRRVLIDLLLVIGLLYVGLLAYLYFEQAKFIFPGHAYQGVEGAVVKPPEGAELVHLKAANGDSVVALYGSALTSTGKPISSSHPSKTLLFFYGNGGAINGTLDLFQRFRRFGVNVIVPDYLGFGMSGGSPGETGCYEAAQATYDYLIRQRKVSPKEIAVLGWSLGGAVAIDLAAREPVAGLITVSTFTSVTEMSRRSYPYVPVSLLLRYPFRSIDKIPRVKCPLLLIHGTADTMVPFGMMDELAKAAGGPVKEFPVKGARHIDVFDLGGEPLMDAIQQFIENLPAK